MSKEAKPKAKKASEADAKDKEQVRQSAARDKLDAYGMDRICAQTADCTPQRTIAEEIGVSWATMISWIDSDKARIEQYMRAREAQADQLAEDILKIADDGSNDSYKDDDGNTRTDQDVIARSRLRVDARKWLASKMAPKRYGEKIETNITGGMTITTVQSATDEELLAIALAAQNKP